jgi:hypothetical protein
MQNDIHVFCTLNIVLEMPLPATVAPTRLGYTLAGGNGEGAKPCIDAEAASAQLGIELT